MGHESLQLWAALICVALLTRQGMSCGVDQCTQVFSRQLKQGKVLVGSNVPYCLLIREYRACLSSISRQCRGTIKYHSLVALVRQQVTQFNCSNMHTVPPNYSSPSTVGQRCLFPYTHERGVSGHRFCQLFGDPHLRTFDSQYETCKTIGAWPVVDNAYFAVQVTNQRVGPDSSATAITKVTVIVKSLSGCTSQKLYEASSSSLPAYFVDGTSSSGDDRRRPAVQLISKDLNSHVELRLRYIAARLSIRRHGAFLSLAVRMPEQIIQQQSPAETGQLCLSGCQSAEILPYKEALAAPDQFSQCHPMKTTFKRQEAVALCREAEVTDFYLDACVFDLLMSGNLVFRQAAKDALLDTRTLYPPYSRLLETNRTDISLYEHFESTCLVSTSERATAAAGCLLAQSLVLALVLLIWLL